MNVAVRRGATRGRGCWTEGDLIVSKQDTSNDPSSGSAQAAAGEIDLYADYAETRRLYARALADADEDKETIESKLAELDDLKESRVLDETLIATGMNFANYVEDCMGVFHHYYPEEDPDYDPQAPTPRNRALEEAERRQDEMLKGLPDGTIC